jgi:acetylglutamate/LysW-gamma-L-alpha-aminoadipate kinase
VVIKIGGALVAQDYSNLIKDIKDLSSEYNFVIVHGGGPQINDLYKKMNKEPKIYQTPQGMPTRHTDPEAIDIVKMALAGYVNKTLVEALQKAGVNAFGCTGADGKMVVAERKDSIMVMMENGKRVILRNEFSGFKPKVDTKIIKILVEQGYLPVIGSLTISPNGELLNTDGDRVANAIAKALNIEAMISLTDVEGIYKDLQTKELIKKIKMSETERILQTLEGGMKKKLFAAIDSIKDGVNKVIITSGTIEKPLTNALKKEGGTLITLE